MVVKDVGVLLRLTLSPNQLKKVLKDEWAGVKKMVSQPKQFLD